MYVLHNVM